MRITNIIAPLFLSAGLMLSSQSVLASSSGTQLSEQETQKIKEEAIRLYKKQLAQKSIEEKNEEIRLAEMKKAFFSYYFQKSVIEEYEDIKKALIKHSSLVNQHFPFHSYMLHGGKVLPPVIRTYSGKYEKFSDTKSRSTETSYHIVKDAKIVTNPPSWKDYLLKTFPKPKQIPEILLPEDDSERALVSIEKEKAKQKGKKHAKLMFEKRMALAKRDIEGISLFFALADMNKVSIPKLSEGRVGIKINGKMLDINQKTFILNDVGSFNKEEKWTPIISTSPTHQ